MPKRCRQITDMIRGGWIPKPGQTVDAYNHKAHEDGICYTIKTNVSTSNLYYVVVKRRT